jgi:hypothetical protein
MRKLSRRRAQLEIWKKVGVIFFLMLLVGSVLAHL